MDASGISMWLRELHLDRYEPNFLDNGYDDWEVITHLDDEDLDAMKITLPGHRKKILLAVKKLAAADTEDDITEVTFPEDVERERNVDLPCGIKDFKQLERLNRFFGENLEDEEASYELHVATDEDFTAADDPTELEESEAEAESAPPTTTSGSIDTGVKLSQRQLEKLSAFFGEGVDTVLTPGRQKIVLSSRQLEKLSRIFGESKQSVLLQDSVPIHKGKQTRKTNKLSPRG